MDAQEVEGWKRDSIAVLAALDSSQAEKITEVNEYTQLCPIYCIHHFSSTVKQGISAWGLHVCKQNFMPEGFTQYLFSILKVRATPDLLRVG